MEQRFQKGEYVVYSNAGVCHVEDIKRMKFSAQDEEQTYYILQPIGNAASTLYIPLDNEKLNAKLRKVLTRDEIDHILAEIKEKELHWEEDKKKRAEKFKEILKEKEQKKMLLLVSCIYLKKQELLSCGKKLNFTDEGVLQEAERYIDEEFAFSLDIPIGQVGIYIQDKLGIDQEERKTNLTKKINMN